MGWFLKHLLRFQGTWIFEILLSDIRRRHFMSMGFLKILSNVCVCVYCYVCVIACGFEDSSGILCDWQDLESNRNWRHFAIGRILNCRIGGSAPEFSRQDSFGTAVRLMRNLADWKRARYWLTWGDDVNSNKMALNPIVLEGWAWSETVLIVLTKSRINRRRPRIAICEYRTRD